MFGLSTKEKITKLIMDVSSEMTDVYKSARLANNEKLSEEDHSVLTSQALKKYQDAVAYECCKRVESSDPYSGSVMRQVLENPNLVGFDSDAFDMGKGAGFVYCAAYYAIEHALNKDMAYCVKLNHLQNDYVLKELQKATLLDEVSKNDKYNCFKKQRPMDANSLYSGTMQVCDMFFSKTNLYPNGENDIDKSKIVGLCAYLIAGWTTTADPKTASEVCYIYGNNFQLYNKPVTYANEMLEITNNTYREIRSVTDKLEKSTRSVTSIVRAQAEKFAQLSSIPPYEENIKSIEETIFYFINQYLIQSDKNPEINKKENTTASTHVTEEHVMNSMEGNSTPSEVHCNICGAIVPTPGEFCPNCGQKVIFPQKSDKPLSMSMSILPSIPAAITQNQSPSEQSNHTPPHTENAKERKCSFCGTVIPFGGQFCPACGIKYVESDNTSEITEKSMNQLRKLKQLYDEGILTEEEYSNKKKQMLRL